MLPMPPMRRIVLSFLCAVWLAAGPVPSLAQQTPRAGVSDTATVLHAYTLKHRRASDAISLVFPLLSQKGTVELQPATNTLVIRDSPAALGRIVPVLRNYDHPSRPLDLEIFIVRAYKSPVSGGPPGVHSDLPAALTRRLRAMLPYDVYEVRAQALLGSREGQAVTYALGGEYEVSFRLGTLLEGQRIRLSDFRVLRRSEERRVGAPLIHSNLVLTLEQTTSFGLARTEESREALMVVMTVRQAQRKTQQRTER